MIVEPTSAGVRETVETHYVWVIHGTFNPPEPGKIKWFQTGDGGVTTFCDALSERLRGTPLEGAVWRSPHGPTLLSWSGQNDHAERIAAGKKLAYEIIELERRDPTARVHLVAHSHGGNVVLKAVEHYQQIIRGARRLSVLPTSDVAPATAQHWRVVLRHDPADERLGRVVFLGTPFLRKQWVDPVKPLGVVARRGLRVLCSLPIVLIEAYVIAMIAYGAFEYFSVALQDHWSLRIIRWVCESLFNYQVEFPREFTFTMNPSGWPTPVVLIACLFTVVLGLWLFLTDSRYFNTNLYFRARTGVQTEPAGRSVPALVVTARFLDEALLGLSSEPFAYANVAMRIREVLWLPGERRIREVLRLTGKRNVRPAGVQIGFDENEAEGFAVPVVWLLRRLFELGALSLLIVWGPLRKFVVRPMLTRTVLDVLNGAACGIPADELRGARVAVLDRLDLPGVFDETYLDVTESVLRRASGPGRPAALAAVEEAERYAFLRSDEALAQRRQTEEASGSRPWAALASSFDDLYERYVASFRLEPVAVRALPMLSRDQFEAQTARAWFTMLERLKEVSGAIELNHSLYQSNPDVLDAIAAFLTGETARRSLPPDYQ